VRGGVGGREFGTFRLGHFSSYDFNWCDFILCQF
jgi:hypothetical protein